MLSEKWAFREVTQTAVFLGWAVLFFLVTPGRTQHAGLPLQTIYFKGDFKLSPNELQRLFPVKENQPVSNVVIAKKIRRFEQALHDEGFLYAKVDSFQTLLTADSSHLNLNVFGVSGVRFKIGKISVTADSLPVQLYLRQLTSHEGDFYRAQKIKTDIHRMLVFAADSGYPFAEVQVAGLNLRREGETMLTDISLRVQEHHKIFIKDIIIKGNVYTKSYVLLRELDIAPGMIYSEKKITAIPRRLNRLDIFKEVGQPDIIKASEDSVYLLIPVTEGNATTFDGVVGYIPQPQQKLAAKSKGYFTGLVNIAYKNLFGTGRKFMVHWQKSDQLSEEFRFSYLEPWLMNYPVNLGLGLERTVRDTTYIEWKVHLRSEIRMTHNFSLVFSAKKRSVIPDSVASRDFRLPQASAVDGEAGIVYDTRDSRSNPRSGIYYSSSYIFSLKTNSGPAYLIQEDSLTRTENLHSIILDAEGYLNFWKNQVFSAALHVRQIKGRRLTVSDYFYFGGSRTLRGYRENQFNGDLAGWVNLEYRFLTGSNSRLFLFSDWGYYQNNLQGFRQDWLYGFGLGLRMDTPLGILGVDYGLGKGDSFAQGKIHFGVINTF